MPTGTLNSTILPAGMADIENDEHNFLAGAKKVLLVNASGTAIGSGTLSYVTLVDGTGGSIGATNGVMGAPVNVQGVSLLTAASRAASGTGTSGAGSGVLTGLNPYTVASFLLQVTGGTGTLDVAVQRLAPDGAGWDSFVRFAQVATASGTYNYVADVIAAPGNTPRALDSTTTVTAASLAAAQVRDIPWGDQIRVIWTLSGTSTFGLSANFRL